MSLSLAMLFSFNAVDGYARVISLRETKTTTVRIKARYAYNRREYFAMLDLRLFPGRCNHKQPEDRY